MNPPPCGPVLLPTTALLVASCAPAAGPAPSPAAPTAAPAAAAAAPAQPAAAAPPPAPPTSGPPIAVRWTAIGNSSQAYVPVVLAEQGIGRKYGFDVQLVGVNTPDQAWNSLRSGDAEVGTGSFLQLLRQRQAGLKAAAVRAYYVTNNPIVAPPDKPYARLADLKGAKMGTPGAVLLDWMILRTAGKKAEGIDVARDAEIVEAAPPLLAQQLARDQLDAAFQFRDFTLEPLADGKLKEVTTLPKVMAAAGFDRDSNSLVYAVSDTWRAQHPSAVPRLVAAIDEALDRIQQDDSVWPALAKRSGVEDARLLPRFVEAQREQLKVTYSADKLPAMQALVDELIQTVGPDAVGIATVDPAAFDFDSAQAAKSLRQ